MTEAPPALTPRQRAIWWTLAVVCAATRFLARARSLWDWDEALFCLGMRSYDVTQHHPHPPGFPTFIALGHIARVFVHDDFRALQTIVLISSVLVFPAMFFLARELRMPFVTAAIAAMLFAFFPNVWFFGGAAFSDIPSIVIVVFAVAMLLRGCRDANAYLVGSFLLALAVGIRPQNFLVGLGPGLIATYYRARQNWRDVLFAAIVGTTFVFIAFGASMHFTGSAAAYLAAVRDHSEYIARVDSYRSPDRPPLWRLFDRFFLKQYDAPPLSVATSLFVVISAAGAIRRRDKRMLVNFLTFGPFAVMAWLMLDRFSISRFSIGYIPMFAIFAADGIERAAAWLGPLVHTTATRAEVAVGGALVLWFFAWTLPALGVVRRELSPPVLGVNAVRQHVDPRHDQLFVAFAMTPFVEYFLPKYQFLRVQDERALPLSIATPSPFLLAEIDMTTPHGWYFRRDHNRLWNIARRHYFDVALEPVRIGPRFVSGWYAPERNSEDEWRWMAAHSVTLLPPTPGPTVLRLQFSVPIEIVPQHPTLTVMLNGALIDRIAVAQEHESRDYHVQTAPRRWNTLDLSTDHTFNPAKQHAGDDARDLGVLIRFLSWGPG